MTRDTPPNQPPAPFIRPDLREGISMSNTLDQIRPAIPRRRGLRMLLLGPLLALLATCTLALPADAATMPATPDTASAAGWHYTSYEWTICGFTGTVIRGGAGGHKLCQGSGYLTVSGSVAYNGRQAWTQWITCAHGSAKGFTVTVTWCGTWNNGAEKYPYYLDLGANGWFTDVAGGHSVWLRIDVHPNGSSDARGGNG